MPSYQYRDSHVKDKTVSRTVLSLTWESLNLKKTVFILRWGHGSRNEVHIQSWRDYNCLCNTLTCNAWCPWSAIFSIQITLWNALTNKPMGYSGYKKWLVMASNGPFCVKYTGGINQSIQQLTNQSVHQSMNCMEVENTICIPRVQTLSIRNKSIMTDKKYCHGFFIQLNDFPFFINKSCWSVRKFQYISTILWTELCFTFIILDTKSGHITVCSKVGQFPLQKDIYNLYWKQTIYWPLPVSVWLLHNVISLIGFPKGIPVLCKHWSITGCQELPSTNRGGMYKSGRYIDCYGGIKTIMLYTNIKVECQLNPLCETHPTGSRCGIYLKYLIFHWIFPQIGVNS